MTIQGWRDDRLGLPHPLHSSWNPSPPSSESMMETKSFSRTSWLQTGISSLWKQQWERSCTVLSEFLVESTYCGMGDRQNGIDRPSGPFRCENPWIYRCTGEVTVGGEAGWGGGRWSDGHSPAGTCTPWRRRAVWRVALATTTSGWTRTTGAATQGER